MLATPFIGGMIQSRLNLFISDNNVIKDRQHGFRKNKGTHTAIATTYETIANALANKQKEAKRLKARSLNTQRGGGRNTWMKKTEATHLTCC